MISNKVIIIAVSFLFFTSCEKNVVGNFGENTNLIGEVEPGIDKRGSAYSNRTKNWSYKTSEVGAHWMYSWGNTLKEQVPENVEFVPMFWGKGSVNADNLDRIKNLITEGKVRYVLGFNEPDGAAQANMSVEEAIALWPQLETLGVPLVSPATVNPSNAWMKEFMSRAEELNLRIDYVAVHHYGGPNVLSFVNKLKETYNAYNRPIWVTEYAVADWNATSPANNRYSQDEVIEFMKGSMEAMDNIDWVYRYSWFDGRQAPLYSSALYDDNFEITSVGLAYADHRVNANIGPGMDTEFIPDVDPNELIINGGFETGTIAPWAGFKNDVVEAAGTSDPYEGAFCGRIQNGDGSLVYVIDVEPGTTYNIRFFSKWVQNVNKTFSGKIRNNQGNALLEAMPDMPLTDQWEETTAEYTVPMGVSQLKLVFFKGQGNPAFFMDNVSLKVKE